MPDPMNSPASPTPETASSEAAPAKTSEPAPAESGASEPEEPKAGASERKPAAPGQMPEYKGEPLDAERGPGLGCFWIQVALLTFFLIFTPLTVTWGWAPMVSAGLLIFTLILLLFTGQTIIFLLRLVAADRRTRRTPLDPRAKPTVGQMEEASAVDASAGAKSAMAEAATTGSDAPAVNLPGSADASSPTSRAGDDG